MSTIWLDIGGPPHALGVNESLNIPSAASVTTIITPTAIIPAITKYHFFLQEPHTLQQHQCDNDIIDLVHICVWDTQGPPVGMEYILTAQLRKGFFGAEDRELETRVCCQPTSKGNKKIQC